VINGPILLSFDVISETELRGSKARNEKKVFPFPKLFFIKTKLWLLNEFLKVFGD
jgi:hypothetical protein